MAKAALFWLRFGVKSAGSSCSYLDALDSWTNTYRSSIEIWPQETVNSQRGFDLTVTRSFESVLPEHDCKCGIANTFSVLFLNIDKIKTIDAYSSMHSIILILLICKF